MKRRIFMIIVCSMALSFLLAGCASSSDTEVDLPEADKTELIESSCGNWSESVNDNPQEVPYVVVNIRTENPEEDRTVFIYEKSKHYYVEQPYAGVWKSTEELYDTVYNYAEPEE